jgi:hypothetical protein
METEDILTPEHLLVWEIHSSWWASWIWWEWGQRLAARYFAKKVNRKWKRFMRSMEGRQELRELGLYQDPLKP